MRSLVAAPTHSCKDYALDRWAAATAKYDRLVAIDSEDIDYITRLEDHDIRSIVYQSSWSTIYGQKFTDAWRAIVENAEGYTHILSLEIDVIPSGDILEAMEAEYDESVMFIRHGVPWRGAYHRSGLSHEMGCTFASVQDWKKVLDFIKMGNGNYTLYGLVGHPTQFKHKDVYVMELEHMDDGIDRR